MTSENNDPFDEFLQQEAQAQSERLQGQVEAELLRDRVREGLDTEGASRIWDPSDDKMLENRNDAYLECRDAGMDEDQAKFAIAQRMTREVGIVTELLMLLALERHAASEDLAKHKKVVLIRTADAGFDEKWVPAVSRLLGVTFDLRDEEDRRLYIEHLSGELDADSRSEALKRAVGEIVMSNIDETATDAQMLGYLAVGLSAQIIFSKLYRAKSSPQDRANAEEYLYELVRDGQIEQGQAQALLALIDEHKD